ncbi:MAG TPA: hypothetical protein P5545_05820 [Bacteroidota bacterium]|nr:hypothetical protein [Candidatus Kapabacteria bacterium]HRS02050.1 hypothetical protein [Bacteroidota bacterium]
MKKSFYAVIIISIIFDLFFIIGCSDNPTTPAVKSNALGLGSGVEPDESYSQEQYAAMFDTTMIYGEISLLTYAINNNSGSVNFSYTLYISMARFWDKSLPYPPEPTDTNCVLLKSIKINDSALGKSEYYNEYASYTAPIYSGSQSNHINIQMSDAEPPFDINLTFPPAIKIDYPTAGKTLYANRKTVLKWNGTNNGYIRFVLTYVEPENPDVNVQSVAGYIRDDGEFTITEKDFLDSTKYPSGEYTISLDRTNPYFIKLPNGKTYLIKAISSYEINFFLKH